MRGCPLIIPTCLTRREELDVRKKWADGVRASGSVSRICCSALSGDTRLNALAVFDSLVAVPKTTTGRRGCCAALTGVSRLLPWARARARTQKCRFQVRPFASRRTGSCTCAIEPTAASRYSAGAAGERWPGRARRLRAGPASAHPGARGSWPRRPNAVPLVRCLAIRQAWPRPLSRRSSTTKRANDGSTGSLTTPVRWVSSLGGHPS